MVEVRLKLQKEVTRQRRKQCPRQGHSKGSKAGRRERGVTRSCRDDGGAVRPASEACKASEPF